MTDIVRTFEEYCTNNDMEFAYGSESHLNLIEGNLNPNKIYILLFPVEREGIGGFSFTNTRFRGKFLMVVSSDYANHYFNEGGASISDSKYTNNIEPMLEAWVSLGNFLNSCNDFDVNSWTNIDAINVLDSNKDGLWCNFSIQTV